MKTVIFNSSMLLNAIETLKKVMVKNHVVSICNDILLQVSNEGAMLVSTNLETFMVYRIEPAMFKIVTEGPFQAMLSVDLLQYLKKIDMQPLRFNFDLDTNSFECLCEDGERVKFSTDKSENYPNIPKTENQLFKLDTSIFAEFPSLLDYVSKDELRPAMTCINFGTFATNFNLVGTDAHKLKIVNIPELSVAKEDAKKKMATWFNLPGKAAKLLTSFSPKKKEGAKELIVKKCINGINISFEFENLTIITRHIDDQYPNYISIIPTQFSIKTEFSGKKTSFLKTLDKASLIANSITHQIRLSLNGENLITAENLDFKKEYSGKIEGSYSGDPIEIGFNAEFLAIVLSSYPENFTLKMIAKNKCALIEHGNSKSLLMPIMLNQDM